jgi:hypothetical protein
VIEDSDEESDSRIPRPAAPAPEVPEQGEGSSVTEALNMEGKRNLEEDSDEIDEQEVRPAKKVRFGERIRVVKFDEKGTVDDISNEEQEDEGKRWAV